MFDNLGDNMYRKLVGLAAFQQMTNKDKQPLYDNVEQDFIWHVRTVFINEYKDCDFEFKSNDGHLITFKVDQILIGKVNLRNNRRMLLDIKKDKWFDIVDRDTYFKAKELVNEWLEYYKNKK